jgi:hypothetical protein
MDSDDVIYTDVLPDLSKFLIDDTHINSDIVIIKSVHKFSDGYTETIQYGNDTVDEYMNSFFYGSHLYVGQLWNFCFRRTFLIQNDIKCPDTYTQEDWCFFLSAYCYAKNISFFRQYFYEYRIYISELSLTGNEFDKQFDRISASRSSFFHRLVSLYESDIQENKKQNIGYMLQIYILLSQWDRRLYQDNSTVNIFLNRLRFNIAEYTDNWNKRIYIAPCFFEAHLAVELINSWYKEVHGENGIIGFIDANNQSPRAKFLENNTGLPVYTINDIIVNGGGGGLMTLYLFLASMLTKL